jgi:hypothetical protein
MYLAPINYNRFFERIFKKPEIAKRFFEDMLNINITEITPFPRKTKLTVDAAYVEFDYRCKIDGQYSILDMQQWYKLDVVKRFYTYHCNNTSLQLETLTPVSIFTSKGKEYKTRNYNQILPTTTIIWMADDCLGYKDDFVSFAMTPELLTDFIRNDAIWGQNDLQILLQLRQQILTIIDNDEKGISFLSQNRLMFVFQKNIVKNPKMGKYVKWFQFAEKTKNENNVEADFELFKNDPIFSMMIEELKVDNFDTDDFQYIVDYAAFEERAKAYDEAKTQIIEEEATRKITKHVTSIFENKFKEMQQKVIQEVKQQAEQEKQQVEQEKQKVEQEKQKVEQEKQKVEQEKQKVEQEKQKVEQDFLEKQLHLVQKCLKRGDSHKEIAEFLEIEDALLEHYIDLLEKKEQNS